MVEDSGQQEKEKEVTPDHFLKLTERKSKITKQSPTLFNKVRNIFPFLQPQTSDRTLDNIHVTRQEGGQKILRELESIKEALKIEPDTQLACSFEAILSPLVREYQNIERKLLQTKTLDESKELIEIFDNWAERAKLWVQLSSIPDGKEDLMKAVVEHTVHLMNTLIDRDLKTLEDYQLQEIERIGLTGPVLDTLTSHLSLMLAPHLEAIRKLKFNKPHDLALDEIASWKEKIDTSRSLHYNEALQIIGNAIERVQPDEDENQDSIF